MTGRQRLAYESDSSEAGESEADPERPKIVDIVSYLAVASAWQIDIIPYTWLPSLGNIGQGGSATIQQSIANLETNFAFKPFGGHDVEKAFNEATSEILVLGNPRIRKHPNIIDLEGICWSILANGEARPVLVFEKTGLGSLFHFMKTASSDLVSIGTRLRLSADVIRAVSILHSCNIFHGDIKHENVLLFESVSKPLRAKITDFSLAVVNTKDSSFRPHPGTHKWRDPDQRDKSYWGFGRAKAADMYSLGLVLLWLIFHDDPNAPEISNQLHAENWEDRVPSWLCALIKDLAVSDHTRGALKLCFLVCFTPNPEQRTQPLDSKSLLKRSLGDRDMETAIDWLESRRLLDNDATKQPLEVLVALIEKLCLHSEAETDLPTFEGSSWPLSGKDQFNLFNIATPLYSAHLHVRASVTQALRNRVQSNRYPSATDTANLAMCLELGFGLERNETESARLLSRLENDMVAVTNAGMEEFRTKYEYRYYNDSKFRTALKLGHISPLDLARTYADSANGNELEIRCERERSDVIKTLGETHHIVCTLTSTLAALYHVRDKLESAAVLQRFVLDTYLGKYGEQSRHTQSAKINLAAIYRENCQYQQAEVLYEEVIAVRTKALGINHIDTLLVQSDLASMYLTRGDWNQAERLFGKVVQQSVAVIGADHPHSILTRGNLASALQSNGKLLEAEKEQRSVLMASLRIHGKTHVDTLTSMSNLMSIYNDRCSVSEASNEHLVRTEEAVQNATKSLGQNHGLSLQIRSNVGQAYIIRGRYPEADATLTEVIDESMRTKGENHPYTITMKGKLVHSLYGQEKWEEAEKLSLSLLSNIDENNLDYPTILQNLAAIYSRQMKHANAVEVASKVYDIRLARYGNEDSSTLSARDILSRYQAAAAMDASPRPLD